MSNKLLIIIVAVFLLMMGMMGAGFFILWSKMDTSSQQEEIEQEGVEEVLENSIGPLFSLKTFIVNLADHGGKRYLRISMDLELTDDEIREELEKRLPQIRDNIFTLIPSKTFTELNCAEGKTVLRDEIIARLNDMMMKDSIKNIYFTEFVIQ